MKLSTISFSIVAYLFCFLSNFNVTAQNNLEPVQSIYDIYDFQFEYYSMVRKVLFKGLSDSPEIRYQVMPSFTPENVLVIEYDDEKKKYYLKYHICKESIWYSDDRKNVKVDTYKKEIDKASVDLIKSLFLAAVLQAKFPKEVIGGNDGTNYYFSVNHYGMKSGTIWSPAEYSNTGKLVSIGNALKELAKSKASIVWFDKKLITQIEKLLNLLKKTE